VSDRLARVLLKIERAGEHLHALYDEFGAVLEADGARLFAPIEFDEDTGECVSKAGEFGEAGARASILAGEVVHQLRSALDHLVWQLVEAQHQTPQRRHAFPVRLAPFPKGFKKTVSTQQLDGVPPAAIRLVERAQPYHARNPAEHWLAVLDGMWQADKHRLLLSAVIAPSDPAALAAVYHAREPAAIEDVRVTLERGQRLEAGAELARLRVLPERAHAYVYVDGRVAFRVDVSEGPGTPVADFDLMRGEVRRLVEQFAPFL
jgi:hypothetical protein